MNIIYRYFILVVALAFFGLSAVTGSGQVECTSIDELLSRTRAFDSLNGGTSIKTNSSGEIGDFVLQARFATDQNIHLLSQVKTVERLEIIHHKNHLISAAGYACLTNVSHLSKIKMCNTVISKEAMEALARLGQLEELDITYSVFDHDAFNGNLHDSNIKNVYLNSLKPLNETALIKLCKMRRIENIEMGKMADQHSVSPMVDGHSFFYTNGSGQLWLSWKRGAN